MTFNIKYKSSSILDYAKNELCPAIWENNKLKSEVRDFIYEQTIQFFERRGIEKYQGFILDCYIASSLASYSYKDDTDLDIKFVIDITAFKKYNPYHASKTDEDIIDYLIQLGRESSELTSYVPNTEHALDPYFYDDIEGIEDNLLKYDSLYSLGRNEWIKEPKRIPKDVPPDYFLEKAKQYAEPYLEKISKDIEKTKQDSIDFLLLRDYLKQLDDDTINEIKYYYQKQADLIDKDIETLIEDGEMLYRLRKDNYSKETLKTEVEKLGESLNYGRGNLIFKLFQRYGYMKILNEIYNIFEDRNFNIEDLPILMTIINN